MLHGRRAFERGEDTAAFESLSRVIEHGNLYADVHYMFGILLDRKGERRAAIESLRRATRINPSYVEALLALASIHETEGDFDRSESYAERASQLTRSVSGNLDPTTRGKLTNQQAALADALFEAGERRDAIAQYRHALDRCPHFHDIRHRLGIALREAGLPFQAAQEFNRILSVHPGMLESQIQLGLTYYSLGRTREAVQQWEAVLERDPSRDEARMYLRLVGNPSAVPGVPLPTHEVQAAAQHSDPPHSDSSEKAGNPDGSAGWCTRTLDSSGAAPHPASGVEAEALSLASASPHDSTSAAPNVEEGGRE